MMVVTHRLQIMQWFPLFYTLFIELCNHDQTPIFGAAWKGQNQASSPHFT